MSRVHLSDDEKEVIATALRQYLAGRGGTKKRNLAVRLLRRLVDSTPGNPNWIHQGSAE